MQDPRYQVFVSSTYIDLIEERRQVAEQLLRSRCIPAGMELFTASALPPWQVITSVLDGTDYVVLILAGRYGSVGSDGRSFTEREYDYAQTVDIPVLPFLHEAPGALPADRVDRGKAAKKLDAFRQKISDSERHTVQFWSDARDLAQKVGTAIHEAIRQQPRPGWVRQDTDGSDDQRLDAPKGPVAFAGGPHWASPFAAPGRNAPALSRPPSYVPGALAQVLASTYYPEPAPGEPDEAPLPHLRLRGAGALVTEPVQGGELVLKSPLRNELKAVVEASDLMRWAVGSHPGDMDGWAIDISSSDRWRVRQALPQTRAEEVSVALEVRSGPDRLSWCVDLDITSPRSGTDKFLISAEDMIRAWFELASLAGSSLSERAAAHLALPPNDASEAVLWAISAPHDLGQLLGLDRLPRDVDGRAPAYAQLLLNRSQFLDREHSLLDWLQRTLLDAGVTDAEDVAAQIIARALSRSHLSPWA